MAVAVPTISKSPVAIAATTASPTDASRWLIVDVVQSEWTKLRTVRSTYWTLFAAMATMIGLSALISAVYVAQYDNLSVIEKANFDPITISLAGGGLGQLAIAVLGVLVVSNEYSSGLIRATFIAVPQRLEVLAAKAAVFATVTLVTMLATAFASFYLGQAILSRKSIGTSLSAPGALRGVVGTGLHLAVLGLLALAIGVLLRKTAGSISAVFGLLFVLPVIVSLLPSPFKSMGKFLPSNAGQALIYGSSRGNTNDLLAPWVGFSVFCAETAAVMAVAAVVLTRRDV